MTALNTFRSVRTVGAVLPSDALARAVDLAMPGQDADAYRLTPGVAINAAAARAWDDCQSAYRAWLAALEKLPDGDPAEGLTRNKWLLPMLYQLGYGHPQTLRGGLETPPGLGETEPKRFPISHRLTWPDDAPEAQVGVPVHLVGAGVALDVQTKGVTKRAPQSMLQDFLNRHSRYLWGVLSNGHLLRILRDGSSLARQAYVEFDLDDIFGNQRYADFRLLFLTAHASRFAPAEPAAAPTASEDDEEAVPEPLSAESCLLEKWRTAAIEDGARALNALRLGVAQALQHLGTGFLQHPANSELRQTLATAPDAGTDLHRALLRIAYRLIVLFVAEDRDVLHPAGADAAARDRYVDFFSTARLRRLATTRAGTRHTDLWAAHLIVTDALARDGLPAIGLPGLAASLFHNDSLGVLADAQLPNRALLAAVRALAEITDPTTGVTRPVDYRHLDSEELGGVYEGLLAYLPRYDAAARTFTLEAAQGNDRKKSGSYYTPAALIALVLDEALDPLIDEARRAHDPEAALLELTVIDPAVGSGHFVVAAARRLGAALAAVRTGSEEPGPDAVRAATADVIGRCVYGVDLNDLAIEITKVALWLEAFDGTRPLPFLDAHFRVGNALLGTTPRLLADNIPDSALAPLTGDDREWSSKLKARNKAERKRATGQLTMFDTDTLDVTTTELATAARKLDDQSVTTLAEYRQRADAWRRFESDPGLIAKKRLADLWCAAFVQPKQPDQPPGITHDTLRRAAKDLAALPAAITRITEGLARRYRFFHWHLEFPSIFTVPEPGTDAADDVNPATGWQGGFSCVLGNPPWERVKIQDKEFFAAHGRDDIVEAKTAAIRKKMIDGLITSDPYLHEAYLDALRTSDGVTHLLRDGGRYPFTGQGDVNTYSVFAETFRTLTVGNGAAGIITETALATGKTTAPFFADLLNSKQLLAFYDFENEAKIFVGVNNRPRFAVTAITGADRVASRSRLAFVIRNIQDVPDRRFELSPDEIIAINPNTGNLPTFRARFDADLTLRIYRRHPVLVREGSPVGDPWGLADKRFFRMFDMAGASGVFRQPAALEGAAFDGWSYRESGREFLPLYEAKMLGNFDHRFGTYRDATQAQINKGTLPRFSMHQHDDPNLEPLAAYWVDRSVVEEKLASRWDRAWLLGWRDTVRSSDVRTFMPSVLPVSAVGDKFLLAFPENASNGPLLHAVWSTLIFDYVSRQKISGANMKYFIVKQLPCPSPTVFGEVTSWRTGVSLADWVRSYVLELSYTSHRLKPYAEEMDDNGPPFRWDPERRALLRADLDAAFLHVYGLTRAEAEHVLESFFVLRKYELRDYGEFRTRRLVLEAYDRMAAANSRGGTGWAPLADIPAGQGPRHAAQ